MPPVSESEEKIRSSFVRLVLGGVRELSPAHYETLIRRARLDRFLTCPPGDDDTPAAGASELARLFAVVYDLVGPQITRLVLRDCGTVYGQLYCAHPLGQRTIAQAWEQPPDQRLGWLIRTFVAQSTQSGAGRLFEETPEAFIVTTPRCYMCAQIHDSPIPICALTEFMVRHVAATVGLHRLRIAEIECGAMGAPHCRLAYYRPAAGG